MGGGGGGGGGGVKGLLRLRPIPIYLSSTRFMAKSLVNRVAVSVLCRQTESSLLGLSVTHFVRRSTDTCGLLAVGGLDADVLQGLRKCVSFGLILI